MSSNNSNNNTILFTILGLSAVWAGIQTLSNKSSVREDFGMLPKRTFKVSREAAVAPGDLYDIPGNYQSMLAPRFSNVDYGAFIRYNMPDKKNQGVNVDNPLIYSQMVYGDQKEDYSRQGCNQAMAPNHPSSMMKTSNMVPSDFSAGNFQQQMNNLPTYTETTDLLPVQSMANGGGAQMLNALGEQVEQPIIYDRYIYANQKSRLYGQGDPIRGDLPIVPMRNEWFRPSVHPQIDLRDGAVMAIAGPNNETSKELLALQSAASGGLLDTGSGINYSVQKSMYSTGAGGDIHVSAYP